MRKSVSDRKLLGFVILLVVLVTALIVFTKDIVGNDQLGVYLEPSTQNVILTWTDGSDNELGFYVYRLDVTTNPNGVPSCINCGSIGVAGSGDCNDPVNSVSGTAGSVTCTDPSSGLFQNHDYDYFVSAYNLIGESPQVTTLTSPSASISVTTVPDAPDTLALVSTTQNSVTLSWNDNSEIEDNFEVERDGVVTGSFAANVGTGTVTGTQAGLASGTTYAYRVRACNSLGCSLTWSNLISATTNNAPVITPAITSITSSTGTVANPSQVLITQPTILTINGNNFDIANAVVNIAGFNLAPMSGSTSTLLMVDLLGGNALCPGLCIPGSIPIRVDNVPSNPGSSQTSTNIVNVIFETPSPTNIVVNPTSFANTAAQTLIISGNGLLRLEDYTSLGLGIYVGSYVQFRLVGGSYAQTYQPALIYNAVTGNLELTTPANIPSGTYELVVSNLGSGNNPVSDPTSSPAVQITVSGVVTCGPVGESCLNAGVCANANPQCNTQTGQWACNYPPNYGAEVCDDSSNLDEDCNGFANCADVVNCGSSPACNVPAQPGTLGVNLN